MDIQLKAGDVFWFKCGTVSLRNPKDRIGTRICDIKWNVPLFVRMDPHTYYEGSEFVINVIYKDKIGYIRISKYDLNQWAEKLSI